MTGQKKISGGIFNGLARNLPFMTAFGAFMAVLWYLALKTWNVRFGVLMFLTAGLGLALRGAIRRKAGLPLALHRLTVDADGFLYADGVRIEMGGMEWIEAVEVDLNMEHVCLVRIHIRKQDAWPPFFADGGGTIICEERCNAADWLTFCLKRLWVKDWNTIRSVMGLKLYSPEYRGSKKIGPEDLAR